MTCTMVQHWLPMHSNLAAFIQQNYPPARTGVGRMQCRCRDPISQSHHRI